MTLDAGLALDLLAAAVCRRGPATTRRDTDGPRIIESVFRSLPATEDCTQRVRDTDLGVLYLGGLLPPGTTIGAVIVLRRAQLAERTGAPWGVVLERAIDAAQAVLDIAPAHLTADESGNLRRCRHRSGAQSPDGSPAGAALPSVADHVAPHHLDGELP